jgi:hypothetical protein
LGRQGGNEQIFKIVGIFLRQGNECRIIYLIFELQSNLHSRATSAQGMHHAIARGTSRCCICGAARIL